jgi:hypothetical protein
MYVTKLKTLTILFLVAGIAIGAGLLAHQPTAAEQPGAKATSKPPETPREAQQGKDMAQAELKKFQGLWQHFPGGLEHQDGQQVVRGPAAHGPWFFIRGH